MKHIKLITEMYNKNPEHEVNSFGWKIPIRTYVDDVFDHITNIYCNEKHISEKSFSQLEEADSYIRTIFDNNTEILEDIEKLKDKRIQYTAEYIYDKYLKMCNEMTTENNSLNEDLNKDKRFPYEILPTGELIKTLESKAKIFLTNKQYDKIKDLSKSIKKQCDNYENMKKTQIEFLEAAIGKVIKDDK